jgi:transposase InsO family protein
MRENGLKCYKKAAFRTATTDSKHSLMKYPNLLLDPEKQHMPTIVGDVTYYDVRGINHYCAHLMDLTNREIIGIAISDRLDADLVCEALRMAIINRGSLEGYIHHTDTDSRYCSHDYVDLLDTTGAEISMCVGNAYENAHSESFNKTLKRQEININQYKTKEESARSIFIFVEKYNTFRPHSALGMLAPIEYRKKMIGM